MRHRHEPPQPGNPYKLTINQHVHSAAAIGRFADKRGNVAVLRKGQSAPFQARPHNAIFCAMRAWNQHLENKFRPIEDAFQAECDAIVRTGTLGNHQAVTEYFSVWQIRSQLAAEPPEDFELAGTEGYTLPKDQEEILEKKHVGFMRGNIVPGRLGAWLVAMRTHDQNMFEMRGVQWGVVRAAGALCPDRPVGPFIPINRETVLVAGWGDQNADDLMAVVNHMAVQKAAFMFGHPEDVAVFSSSFGPAK